MNTEKQTPLPEASIKQATTQEIEHSQESITQ